MFNEDSRVKIPAVLHIARLGYTYLSKKGNKWEKSNNIFPDIFAKSIEKINPGISTGQIENLKKEISLDLSNQDLGYQFYNKLVDSSGIKLIDFDNVENNTFNVLTELTYEKDDEEFRPDITLLVNGIPLVFKGLGGFAEDRCARRAFFFVFPWNSQNFMVLLKSQKWELNGFSDS